jgi:hypothetical protein
MTRGLAGSKQSHRSVLSLGHLLLGGVSIACLLTIVVYVLVSLNSAPLVENAPSASVASDLVDVLIPIDKIEAGTALESSMFRKESRLAA